MENTNSETAAMQAENPSKSSFNFNNAKQKKANFINKKTSNELLSSTDSKLSKIIMTSKENFRTKFFKMKDLDLLKTKSKPIKTTETEQQKEEEKRINKILNEPIYIQTEPSSNKDAYSIETINNTKGIINPKNKSKKNLNFVTKEKKLVNIIQLHDHIYTSNIDEFSNNTFHTMPNEISNNFPNETVKNSKLKSMKNYSSNMDYYKYMSEVNKKHMLNAEFNMKTQFEFLINQRNSKNFEKDFAYKNNISYLLRMNSKDKTNEIIDGNGNNKYYAEILDANKLFDRQEGEKIEEYVFKNSSKGKSKNNLNDFANSNEKDEAQKKLNNYKNNYNDNELEDKLRLEHKKPNDYLLMLSKKAETSCFTKNTSYSFNTNNNNINTNHNSNCAESTYKTKAYLDAYLFEQHQNSNNNLKHKFYSDSRLSKISKEENYIQEDQNVNFTESTVFHKNAQTEINYKLDKQRKEFNSLFYLSKKTNLNREADPASAYKNIYFNMNRRTIGNQKELNIRNDKDNSFEKFKDYLNKKDKLEEILSKVAFDFIKEKEKNKNDRNLENAKLNNIDINSLPAIVEKKLNSENKNPIDNVNCNTFNNDFDYSDQNKSSKEKVNTENINSNKQEKLNFPTNENNQNPKNSYLKKDNLKIDTYKIENQKQASDFVAKNLNLLEHKGTSRYINPINNNIYSIADIEIFNEKSQAAKLIKAFTPDILSSGANQAQKKLKSEIKNENKAEKILKEKDFISVKEPKYSKNNLKTLSRINTLKTENVSNYIKETCPTEVTYVNTVSSKDKSNSNSSRIDKHLKIKKLEEKMNIGKINKLEQLKSQISVGFGNMVNLEEKIKNCISDSTQDFRNKLNNLQERHYSMYKNEWCKPAEHFDNL